jgi:hypothetical protein
MLVCDRSSRGASNFDDYLMLAVALALFTALVILWTTVS